ncbi:hypothetical protein L873DRAFT_249397 [Choiromyces venosus 120613-1]|uniref:HNH nuclease domain-containing protein n=1 Tax=Choiromyces venosus 120613-1 TaxID=1336337 RepID=A0A3N4J0R9_9PEZI|nr:hypothetical protein L873DRAFT_249397 [Choiromyces venosus 120613-1]
MTPPRKTIPEKACGNILVSWADIFLATFYAEHCKKHPGANLPSFPVSAQGSLRHKVCQVSLCDALIAYAPDSGSVAEHLLHSIFGSKAMKNLENLQICGIPDYFKTLCLKPEFPARFEKYCRGWLHGLLIPLSKKQNFSTLTTSQLNQMINQKTRCLSRDGYRCPVTGSYDRSKLQLPQSVQTIVTLDLTHIIPLQILTNPLLQKYFRIFTGLPLSHVRASSLNHPRNALVLEANAHRDFVSYNWGITTLNMEAFANTIYDDPSKPSVKFKAEKTGAGPISFKIPNKLLSFGAGKRSIELPDQESLAFHLAVGKVLHESGVGETLASCLREIEILRARGEWADEAEDVFDQLENSLVVAAAGSFVVR